MNKHSNYLNDTIGKLSFQHLALFCNLNCEKLLPCYKAFTEVEDWGDISFFITANEYLYHHLFYVDSLYLESLDHTLDQNYPNLDDFHSVSASYAFDMCGAFDGFLQFLKTYDKTNIFKNAQSCINTVDMFVQQKENIGFVKDISKLEELIANDKYMIKEKERQSKLLSDLSLFPVVNSEVIAVLRVTNDSFGDLIDIPPLLVLSPTSSKTFRPCRYFHQQARTSS